MSDTALPVWNLLVLSARTKIFKKGKKSQREETEKSRERQGETVAKQFPFHHLSGYFLGQSPSTQGKEELSKQRKCPSHFSLVVVLADHSVLFSDTPGQRYPADN